MKQQATPEQIKLAQRLDAMAQEPIDDMIRTFVLMGAPPYMRRIVLEAVAQKALAAAAQHGRDA